MPFTMDDLHDLIRLLETRPEWRAELRRLVLTEELLAAPDQLAALRARSEEQFQALVEAQQRTNIQLTTLTERVTALPAAQERMDRQFTIPVVAGEHILPEAAELARRAQVWQVTDGRAISPAATPSSP